MNVNPSAAASVAGTSRAAARGGETEKQEAEATARQSASEKPGGKSVDSSEVDAGDQTSDRHGNGQQVLDVFERSDDTGEEPQEESNRSAPASPNGSGEHLDLEA